MHDKSTEMMHININASGAGGVIGAWRSEDANSQGFITLEHYQKIAALAEKGLCDALFLADQVALSSDIEHGPGWGSIDPVIVMAAIVATTSNLGLIATATTTFSYPYSLARTFSSLDHLSGGRVGINLVTTMDPSSAYNFSQNSMLERNKRYERAAEFCVVLKKLWDSWEADALLPNKKKGLFAAKEKIHAINHDGEYFSVRGPLQLPRSPQRYPFLVQAGGSDEGVDFAVQSVDAVFVAAQSFDDGKKIYASITEKYRKYGRKEGSIKILPGLTVVIGETAADAAQKRDMLNDLTGDSVLLTQFVNRFKLHDNVLDMNKPLDALILNKIRASSTSQGFSNSMMTIMGNKKITLREVLRNGVGHRIISGTPEQIANEMEYWFRNKAADGFNIMADIYPSGLETFVSQVIPILQKRGVFRTAYEEKNLRERYGAAI